MKKTFASHTFALLTAAFMMVGSVACSTAPTQEEAPAETSVSTQSESAVEDTVAQAPVVEEASPELQDTVSGSTTDPMSAPSSLGASSSGRGH